LNHPNIITIYDIDSANSIDFIAMEYVAGKTLDEVIPKKGMRLNQALKIAVQVADAPTTAHDAGIVHRDLKPSNVMVGDDDRVRVLDFGREQAQRCSGFWLQSYRPLFHEGLAPCEILTRPWRRQLRPCY